MEQYLILIENLVREGKSEREIEQVVEQAMQDDVEAVEEQLDELERAA